MLSGKRWHAKAFLESIGPGFEGMVGVADINIASSVPNPYTVTFDIPVQPAVTFVAPNDLGEGVYELTVLITLHNMPGDVPFPISAFSDGITISLYDAI
jgi:hypothetical protein